MGTDPPPVSDLERTALDGDSFCGNWCVRCGRRRSLFNLPTGRLVAVCPQCVVNRIDRLEREGHELPESLRILRTEGVDTTARQKRREESLFKAPLLDLYKCARCGRMISKEDARYHFPTGALSSPPYCESCLVALSGQQPEEGEPEMLLYACWRDARTGVAHIRPVPGQERS
jgi:DNA-directed RNA polymerase subunit RPC12/RpoP